MRTLLIITAYIAPFVFIPAVFRWSGSVLGNLSGMVNNRSKGIFDRQRNYRGNKRKQTKEDILTGNRFKGNSRLAAYLSTKNQSAGLIKEARFNPRRAAARIQIAKDLASERETDKTAEHITQRLGQNDTLLAGAKFTKREDIKRALLFADSDLSRPEKAAELEESIEKIMDAQRDVSVAAFQKARIRVMGKTGTGYQREVWEDEEGNEVAKGTVGAKKVKKFDVNAVLDDINYAYGNDRNGAGGAVAQMKGLLLQSGQGTGNASFGTWKEQLDNRQRSKVDAATGALVFGWDKNGNRVTDQQSREKVEDDARRSTPPGYHASMKPSSIATMADSHYRYITRLTESREKGEKITFTDENGNEDPVQRVATLADIAQAGAAVKQIWESMNSTAPQLADQFAARLMSKKISGVSDLAQTGRTEVTNIPETDANGNNIKNLYGEIVYKVKPLPDIPAPKTIRQFVEIIPNLSEEQAAGYRDRRFEYGSAATARTAAEVAAAAAAGAAGKPPGGIPPTPGGPQQQP